jgi:hypothetical protein
MSATKGENQAHAPIYFLKIKIEKNKGLCQILIM